MIVKLLSSGGVSVIEVDNLRELKVVTSAGVDVGDAQAQLAGLGHVSDEHVWLEVDALREAARPSATAPNWESEFRSMILYASAMGWTDGSARSVRAHVESEEVGIARREEPGAPHACAP